MLEYNGTVFDGPPPKYMMRLGGEWRVATNVQDGMLLAGTTGSPRMWPSTQWGLQMSFGPRLLLIHTMVPHTLAVI